MEDCGIIYIFSLKRGDNKQDRQSLPCNVPLTIIPNKLLLIRLVDCWILNVQRQLFHTYSGREKHPTEMSQE